MGPAVLKKNTEAVFSSFYTQTRMPGYWRRSGRSRRRWRVGEEGEAAQGDGSRCGAPNDLRDEEGDGQESEQPVLDGGAVCRSRSSPATPSSRRKGKGSRVLVKTRGNSGRGQLGLLGLWAEEFFAGVWQRNDIAGGDLELDRSWALSRGKERERGSGAKISWCWGLLL